MANSTAKLELHLPERKRPGPGSFDVSPKHVKSWAESLPLADSGETARLVFDALTEVNGFELNPLERVRFLELFRAPVRHVAGSLERHYIGKPFPLPDKNREVAELAREFQGQMA